MPRLLAAPGVAAVSDQLLRLVEQPQQISENLPDGSLKRLLMATLLSQNNAGLTQEELEAVGDLDFSGLTDEEMLELQGKIEVRPPDLGQPRLRL